mmetsp:Transcript_28330/g.95383  ORF Transcript_28330/g.95383 Transcript_28330/m.95383 type:complete len:112 (+) Transcript_28330:33-368(+)
MRCFMMFFAALLSADAFSPVSQQKSLAVTRTASPAVRNMQATRIAATPKMEVWSEKNFRLTLLAAVGLPVVGIVTPPDTAIAAALPLAIAAVFIYIFVDLLVAATPQGEEQ